MTIKKKRRGFFDDDFFDFFSNFEEEFERMSREMFRSTDLFEQLRKIPKEELNKKGIKMEGPFVYGFSMKIGPEGKPEIRQFGNLPKIKEKGVMDEREPLVDVIDKKDEICVMAEVPGVEKKDINLTIKNDKMTIDVKNPERKYNKTITLPADVEPDTAKANYKNGVLEVILKKSKKKIEGKRIVIE